MDAACSYRRLGGELLFVSRVFLWGDSHPKMFFFGMKSPFRKNGGLIDGILFVAFAIAPYKTDRVLILLEFSYWVSNDDVSKMVVRKRGPFSWSMVS